MARRIKDIITQDVIVVNSTDSIHEAASKMNKYSIGFLPVLDGDRIAGVVTDRDLVIRGLAEGMSIDTPVSEVMTRNAVSIDVNSTVDEATQIMSDMKIRRLCVVDKDSLIGVCALGDMAVRQVYEDEAGMTLSVISTPTRQQLLHQ